MVIPPRDMPDSNSNTAASSVTIPLPEPFSYREALIYLSRSPQECLHAVEGSRVMKLLEIEGKARLIEIREAAGSSSLELVFADGLPGSRGACEAAADYVTEWLDLNRDMTPFYRLAEKDSILGKLASDYRGLRIAGIPDLFEALVWAVIGQQINLAFAYTLKKRFVAAYGKRADWQDRNYWLFPKPSDLTGAAAGDLQQLQFTGKKAETVLRLAQLMDSGAISKSGLLALGDFQEAERQLTAIPGIGPWTANYVRMRCLRDPSAFPIGDAALHNALKLLLKQDSKPAEAEIRQLFTPWSGWEAYAVFYLWRTLSPAPPGPER
ncbi:DNA-3-methyladenine glycosylase [Paenibacillus filicis]|uniref:DNA-3-methyladenine glycosylase II n=1 Tax=Paenibacillus gyeongsangnamensis TaxID=3388067 RepID=A0ABT4Q5Q8_9BACL|nr:DNA-3-methyladenine glycosylase [Paenibacillus filicis]MCZ8512210.1 DNA-3-methyladenine glycosylase [Paenibacillus filicis]